MTDPLPPETRAFHRDCLVLDLHIDTLLWMRLLRYDIGTRHRNRIPGAPFCWHLDLPRAADGGLDASVFGLVINPTVPRRELMLPLRLLARAERGSGFAQTLDALELLRQAEQSYPDRLAFARSGSEIRRAVADGRFAALPCLEGSHGIGGEIDNARKAHARGLRMLGLVHFQATEVGYPMTVDAFEGRGLTPFGFELLAELERLGIVVDLAHLNARGVDDALSVLKRPFVVSHTACRALHDRTRNLTDDQIRRVADRGGVVGIAVGRDFLGRRGVDGYLDHVEHAMRVGGEDAVAIGSDYDGAIVPAVGMGDVRSYPLVTHGLLARGHAHDAVRKLLGENALRVITDVCG
ncbi:MAG: membrane dipeptidase [Deltaproteobacteria bacterium]|nr:MAG: membrane dipeptidase [Deltaproteobacteria bacterium]